MISSAIGTLALANTLSGGRLSGFAKKNIGKFAGKVGKWGMDKLASNNVKNKINGWIEKGSDYVGKALGEDSEISKNLKNFSKEMKGEHTELRAWNDGESKTNNVVVSEESNETAPYSKNLGGTNYKRYVPAKHLQSPLRVDLKHIRNKIAKFGVKNK